MLKLSIRKNALLVSLIILTNFISCKKDLQKKYIIISSDKNYVLTPPKGANLRGTGNSARLMTGPTTKVCSGSFYYQFGYTQWGSDIGQENFKENFLYELSLAIHSSESTFIVVTPGNYIWYQNDDGGLQNRMRSYIITAFEKTIFNYGFNGQYAPYLDRESIRVDQNDISCIDSYEPVIPPTDGGGGGGGLADSPFDTSNDDPLPCEVAYEPNFADINVKAAIAQEAIMNMLPPFYQQYIRFDSSGKLDLELLKSGKIYSDENPYYSHSILFDALAYVATQPGIDINIHLTPAWEGHTTQDPNGRPYFWETQNQTMWGITVIPGDVPIAGIPVTGDNTVGEIYINDAKSSSRPRLALIVAHELLGHMYRFLKGESYTHGDPRLESWISTVEELANLNWKLLKKWKLSKLNCPK